MLREHENVIQRLQRLADITCIVVAHVIATAAYSQTWRRESSNATLAAVLVFTIAAELVNTLRAAGVRVWMQASSPELAAAAIELGVNGIVAQGAPFPQSARGISEGSRSQAE